MFEQTIEIPAWWLMVYLALIALISLVDGWRAKMWGKLIEYVRKDLEGGA